MRKSSKILIVEDSTFYTRILKKTLAGFNIFKSIDSVTDGDDALRMHKTEKYDLITLDVMMPGKNGIETLMEIRKFDKQTPVIMISSYTTHSAMYTIRALQNGATDFITKPSSPDILKNVESLERELKTKIVDALHIQTLKESPGLQTCNEPAEKKSEHSGKYGVIAIGASTGGINSLTYLLKTIQDSIKIPIVVVQHVPKFFMEPLLTHLRNSTSLDVRVPVHGQRLAPETVYIAPAGSHFKIHKVNESLVTYVDFLGEAVGGYKPSIDNMFYSLAISSGKEVISILLSGMGVDGVKGTKAIFKAGGMTIAQSPDSSVVPGIIIAALRAKAIRKIVPLQSMPGFLISETSS